MILIRNKLNFLQIIQQLMNEAEFLMKNNGDRDRG